MAAFQFKQNFTKGINLDLDQLRMPQDAAQFIKNLTLNVNVNASAGALAGQNQLVYSPLEGNTQLSITLPGGTNYCIGFYSSEQTNEGYFFIWNSGRNHTIWVINGDTGATTKVYQDNLAGRLLLPFPTALDPQYFISEGRCTLELRSYISLVTGLETNYKFLIFANNFSNQFLIEVNSSIATTSFTTTFFTSSSAFYDPIELVHLGVPTPLKTIGLDTPTAYSPVPDDQLLQNALVRNAWQFRYKTVDFFGRESIHGIISDTYLTIVGGGCIAASNGLQRCVDINFDAGNPYVNQIQIEFRKWSGDDRAGALASNWQIADIFNKYDNSTGEYYQRSFNPAFTTSGTGIVFNPATNIIAYTFCADKNNIPIDPAEAALTEPELPRISSTVFSIATRIGLGNNVRDFQPISPTEIAKVTYSTQLPAMGSCEAAPIRQIIIYASIIRPLNAFSGSTSNTGIVRTSFGQVVFGNADGPCGAYGSFSIDQVFGDQSNPGFIGYMAGMAGSTYSCVSQQVDLNPATGADAFVGYGSGIGFPHVAAQKFVLNVPAGKYLFRIASHKATINDADFQKTSTYVCGHCHVIDLSIPGGPYNFIDNLIKEIEIDCTAGDVILNQPADPVLIIYDLGGGRDGTAVIDGYLYEQNGIDVPVEMNAVYFQGLTPTGTISTRAFGSFFTDHNGYFFAGTDAEYCKIIIIADLCGGSGPVIYDTLTEGIGGIKHGDGTGTPSGACLGVHGNWRNRVYLTTTVTPSFPSCGRRLIKERIALCDDHLAGVPGIPVVMTKGATGVTDANGQVEIVAHNRYSYAAVYAAYSLPILASGIPNFATSPNNKDVLIFSQKGGCPWSACGGCIPSVADVVIDYIDCSGCPTPRVTTLSDFYVNVVGINIYGVQSGGKYLVGFWLHDAIGRHTAVQVLPGESKYVYTPNLNDTTSPYPTFALSQIAFDIDSSFAVDPIFTKMTFLVGANVLFTDFFSWAADWVQPIDSTGYTNPVNPIAIRIYYGSLNEYKKANNFSVNCNWEFIPQATTGSPVEGDVVQFIMNGDGVFFTPMISQPVTYDASGLFFTIEYTVALAGLKNGALFRVIRPSQNTSGEDVPLYEQCLTIPLINGVPQVLTGVIPYRDSYMVARELPVPIIRGEGSLIPPGGVPPIPITYTSSNIDPTLDAAGYSTNNINNKNQVVIFSLEDGQMSFPFFFESPSPSDFWGSHLASRGRVGVINPYEAQSRIGTEIALSDALSSRPNGLNGLSYFEAQNVQVFDKQLWGDIQLIFVETSIMLVICDRDHFLLKFNTSQLVTNPITGVVEAQNTYGIFNAPDRKSGTNYGLSSSDINTARKYAGKVFWLDSTGYMVMHNFAVAVATQVQGYEGYLKNKIAAVKVLNLSQGENGLTYFHGGIDPKTWEYYFTSFNIPHSGSPSYINTQSQMNLNVNETLVLDMDTGMIKGFASFTPEFMGNMPGFFLQSNFFTFKQGHPYFHHAGVGTVPAYANFYGTQCEVRITAIVNPGSEKVKRFFYVEVYTKQSIGGGVGVFASALLYCDTITTEKGQSSRLAVQRWDIKDGYQCAQYLCDLNTPADTNLPVQTGIHKILDGNTLIGRWLSASYTNNPAWAGTYFEISAVVNYGNGVEKSAD